MKSPFQYRILTILAQQTGPIPVTQGPVTTPGPITTPGPTTPANATSGPTTVPGSPTNFDPFQFFPTMTLAWGSKNVVPIRHLCYILNYGIFILSNGALDINRLRGSNFVIDPSQYSDPILRGLVKYVQQCNRIIFTNYTAPFKIALTEADKKQRVQMLKNFLNTFQIPDGGINAFLTTKIGGNLKAILLDTLSQIT